MKNKKQTLIDLQAIYDHAKHLHDDIQLRKNSPNRLIRDNSHSAILHYCNYEIAEMSMQPDHLDMIEKHISCANEKINALNEESNAIEESLHQSQMQVETTEAMYLKIVVSGNADDIEQAEKKLLEKTTKLENQKSFALRKQQAYDNAIQLLSDEVEIWNRIKKGVSRSIKTQKIKPTILKLKTAYDEFYKLYDESIDELREFYPEELKALCLPDIRLLKQSMQINKRQFLFKEDLFR